MKKNEYYYFYPIKNFLCFDAKRIRNDKNNIRLIS